MELEIKKLFDPPRLSIKIVPTAAERAIAEHWYKIEYVYDPGRDVPEREVTSGRPPYEMTQMMAGTKSSRGLLVHEVLDKEHVREVTRYEMDYAHEAIIRRVKWLAERVKEKLPDAATSQTIKF